MTLPRLRLVSASVLIGILALLAFAHATPTLAHEYIVNGGFESGTEGWTLLSPGSTLDTEVDGVVPVEGAGRARLTLGRDSFVVGQSLADVPPGPYELSMAIKSPARASGLVTVTVTPNTFCNDGCAVTLVNYTDEWQVIHITASFHIGGLVSVRISGKELDIGDVIYIDNVRFEGAPPATMTSTFTATALPPTSTPVPPSPTKTPRVTATATPDATPVPVVATTPLPVETIANGSFEEAADGMPVGWAKYGGSLSSATAPIHSGAMSARLESTTDSTKWLFETIVIRGGAAYAFDAWLLHNDVNTASAFLRVSWYPTDDGSGEAIATADSTARLDASSAEWRYVTTGGITAPAEAHSAKVRVMLQPLSTVRTALYVDDASFGPADPAFAAPAASAVAADEPVVQHAASVVAGTAHRPGVDAAPRSVSNPGAKVLINEVVYDAVGDGDDANGEWVELYNGGLEPVSLEGWRLADGSRAIELGAIVLQPRSYVVLAATDSLLRTNSDLVASLAVTGRIGNGLRNEGDVLVLLDPSGRFVDAISWGDNASAMNPAIGAVPAGHSIERRSSATDTDTAGDFVDNEAPSPGRAYAALEGTATSRAQASNGVEILAAESPLIDRSLAWLVAALAIGVLVAVAFWRFIPSITQRLRHQ